MIFFHLPHKKYSEFYDAKANNFVFVTGESTIAFEIMFSIPVVPETVVSLHRLRMSRGEINKALNGRQTSLHYL